MGRPGITEQSVCAAADELQLAGVKVSQTSVRAKLGSGGMGTITRHLATWRAQRAPVLVQDPSLATITRLQTELKVVEAFSVAQAAEIGRLSKQLARTSDHSILYSRAAQEFETKYTLAADELQSLKGAVSTYKLRADSAEARYEVVNRCLEILEKSIAKQKVKKVA